ncbi:MAG: Hsp33 family molecular chaperone HslO [Deltaproteobacteria bacterium]|nr:Hsp33 family molecular chaperone HslO [Deltaproteobacteria bacterium]
MTTEMKLHLARYMKYLDEGRNVLVITGNVDEILISRHLYEQRHGINSADGDTQQRLLNVCALAATSLSDRESWGWTLTLNGSDEGYFVGMEPEGMICTRQKPADPNMNRVYLQRQKNDGPLMQSHFEPKTDCPVKTIEQYFNEVVQTQTRVAVHGKTGVLVQALPNADFSALEEMDDKRVVQLFTQKEANGELKQLQEFLVFYECRCDEEMIYKMVDQLPDVQKNELFADQNTIEVECPRCGRNYTATRNDTPN